MRKANAERILNRPAPGKDDSSKVPYDPQGF